MPSFLAEGNTPSPSDTEVRSLWKINSLAAQWAIDQGVTPKIPWLQGFSPAPADTEVISLQKINACLYAIANK